MSNSLASVHPELIPEWSERNLPLTPDKITFGSNKRVWWKGACGHEWETSVKARSKGEKCPICSGARVIEGINDLVTLKPLLAQEWSEKNKLKPTEVSVASHKKIIWKCKHGHEWEASVKSRTINGTGCPYCSHNKVLAGFNDLASQYPDIAAEWSNRNLPLLPTMVTAFANSKAWWKCRDCGNEWYTLISTRAGGSRCPYCSGYTLLKGFNDLATTHPDIAAEWSERNYPLMPDEVNAKSRHNVWWKCKTCGNEWKSVINARVKGTVCPVCADRTVLAGYNDLATTDRKLLAEWDYEKNSLLPTQVSRRSMKRVWWKCSLGHSWKAKISDRTIIGEKCTVCEKEYRSVFPGLAVAYYANQKGLKVQLGSDKLLGMAAMYGFNQEQKDYLAELLQDENNQLWSQVLYGIGYSDDQIVTVALSQVGNVGGQPYWSWYGFDSRVEWCACFVSWCANECGYIDAGIIPKYAGCVNGVQWFRDRGQWADGSYEPSPGTIIFFDWEGDGVTDHTGIVQRCENGTVYTVEGNSGDTCRTKTYPVGSSVIYGYGIPAY